MPADPGSVRRTTRQRTSVVGALDSVDGFVSARELHTMLADRGDRVGIATVYRTLAALAGAGEVDVLLREDGESVYRRCSGEHHHHLVCRECGATVEVTGPTVEAWASAEAARHGFTDVRHTIEITGVCAGCAAGYS